MFVLQKRASTEGKLKASGSVVALALLILRVKQINPNQLTDVAKSTFPFHFFLPLQSKKKISTSCHPYPQRSFFRSEAIISCELFLKLFVGMLRAATPTALVVL